MGTSHTLLFVSPRFLFPVDSGGKIRTTQVLRGLKGGRFRIHLVSPGSARLARQYAHELTAVCDEFDYWPLGPERGLAALLRRAWYLHGSLPMPVRIDRSGSALHAVSAALAEHPAIAVFDFLHAAVFAPARIDCASVLFTHNVESEIFARHRDLARNPWMRAIWTSQHRKMYRYERQSLQKFDVLVAVAERDARTFRSEFGISNALVIPTGVDLDFFRYTESQVAKEIVFCGSMDWRANQDALCYFMDRIWTQLAERVSDVRLTVVGRSPPAWLVSKVRARSLPWTFTGFVDDVRPIVSRAAVSVIPLRVGGGTRLKVYESMAMGPVVVSTTIGVEGLPLVAGKHCLVADEPAAFADAVASLLQDPARRAMISVQARRFVEQNFGYRVAARGFEQACLISIDRHTVGRTAPKLHQTVAATS